MWVTRGDEVFWETAKTPQKPFELKMEKTPEEEFRKQVAEMDANTNMNRRLDEDYLRKMREDRIRRRLEDH